MKPLPTRFVALAYVAYGLAVVAERWDAARAWVRREVRMVREVVRR